MCLSAARTSFACSMIALIPEPEFPISHSNFQRLNLTTPFFSNSQSNLCHGQYPMSPELTSAGCWADDLRDVENIQTNFNWHFIDLPVVRKALTAGLPPIDRQNNVAWAIESCRSILNASAAHPTKLSQSLYTRFLVHFVGDVHQPLHSASLFDDVTFPPPLGDLGGNAFRIQGANVSNLHSFWDSGAGQWQDDPVRPLNTSALAYLDAWADTLEAANPMSSLAPELEITAAQAWAAEGNAFAVNNVYNNLQPNQIVSPQYIADSRALAQRQVALGGYRLARTLNTLFV